MKDKWFSECIVKPAAPPAARKIRKPFGLEAAQVTSGCATADVSQIYAERDLSLAVEIMRKIG